MQTICQSCEKNPQEIIESCDSKDAPYRICKPCHFRLLSRALRPIEWYNLAKRGWGYQYLLHDDFYDDDGVASHPLCPVEDARSLPAPRLLDIKHDARLLLDYTITRWSISEEMEAYWRQLSTIDVQLVLEERFKEDTNFDVRDVVLKVTAIALKNAGATMVREAWKLYPNVIFLPTLIETSAACLPFNEAFSLSMAAIDSLPRTKKLRSMPSLAVFQSPKVLDWIERNVSEPLVDTWGDLSAASAFSWPRAVTWLHSGRPLSLVAIDAIRAIANPNRKFLRSIEPTLFDAPSEQELRAVLLSYAESDGVPRVKQRIGYILQNAERVSLNNAQGFRNLDSSSS